MVWLAQGQQLEPVKPEGQKASVYAVALDEEGRLLASGSPSAMLRINDCRSGAKIMKLRGHTENIRCVRVYAIPDTIINSHGGCDAGVSPCLVSSCSSEIVASRSMVPPRLSQGTSHLQATLHQTGYCAIPKSREIIILYKCTPVVTLGHKV